MTPNSLLIANRGEIAIRIIRAAAEMGIRTVAIFPDDDSSSLHTRKGRRGAASERRGRGRVPRRRTDYRARQRGGLRRDPSRLRLSQRERRLRAAMRRRGNHVRRTARRDARALRRQGAGASAGRAMRRADPARHLGRDEPRRGATIFFVAGRGRFDDDQSGRRRRRPRDARGLARRGNRGSIQALPVGGARVVRRSATCTSSS